MAKAKRITNLSAPARGERRGEAINRSCLRLAMVASGSMSLTLGAYDARVDQIADTLGCHRDHVKRTADAAVAALAEFAAAFEKHGAETALVARRAKGGVHV